MPTKNDYAMLYKAQDDIDASLRIQRLEENGIRTFKMGGTLRSFYGEIPAPLGLWVELWVNADQLEQATQIMHAFEKERGQTPDDKWACKCGELNPRTFDVCWKCGKTFGISA